MLLTVDMMTEVEQIDSQHRQLFSRIDVVETIDKMSITKEKALQTLGFLGEYIVEHFKEEEKLQKESRYPHFKEHRKQHKWYVGEFKKLKKEYSKNGFSESFSFILNESIVNWYSNHVLIEDVKLGKYLNESLIT